MSVNILTPLTDIDASNGGTLEIPGSRRVLSEAVRAGLPVGKRAPAINIDAPAGTMVLTDGPRQRTGRHPRPRPGHGRGAGPTWSFESAARGQRHPRTPHPPNSPA